MNTEQDPIDVQNDTPESAVVEATPSIPAVAPTVAPALMTARPFYKKSGFMIAAGVAVLLIFVALYYVYALRDDVVAIVNGEKLYQTALNENIENIQRAAQDQGVDTSDPTIQEEIRQQSFQALIDNALILAAAEEAGITANAEEVDALYSDIISQLGGTESSVSQLAAVGLTTDELRSNIEERITIETYLASVTDSEELTVTEEDVTEFLAPYANEELPPLEEIRAEVERQILLVKQQNIFLEVIEDLRSKATIEERI